MFSNIKSENSLGNLCGYVTIRFCVFASFNDLLLFLSYIKHLISKLCREEVKEEKSEMSCPVSSAREHEPIMFPQAPVPGEGWRERLRRRKLTSLLKHSTSLYALYEWCGVLTCKRLFDGTKCLQQAWASRTTGKVMQAH